MRAVDGITLGMLAVLVAFALASGSADADVPPWSIRVKARYAVPSRPSFLAPRIIS